MQHPANKYGINAFFPNIQAPNKPVKAVILKYSIKTLILNVAHITFLTWSSTVALKLAGHNSVFMKLILPPDFLNDKSTTSSGRDGALNTRHGFR